MLKRAIFLCIGLYSILLLNQLRKIRSASVDERTFSNAIERLENNLDNIRISIDEISYKIHY